MNNPRMSNIIESLFKKNNPVNEGYVKDKKVLNNLCDDFIDFLKKKKFVNYDELGVDHGGIIATVDGDWKHEHLYFKSLVRDFFEKNRGYSVNLRDQVTRDSGSDDYGALYHIDIMESAISEDATIDSSEAEDDKAFNAFLDMLENNIENNLIDRLDVLVNKFSSTPLNSIMMTNVEPMSGIDFFTPSKLVVFELSDGLATEPETNKGVVAVIILPSGVMHLIDTEILENDYYKNTVLYNLHQLESMSKMIWIGDVDLK